VILGAAVEEGHTLLLRNGRGSYTDVVETLGGRAVA
jgi:hypothetical protein